MGDKQFIFVVLAALTSAAASLGLACEILELALNAQGLMNRLAAYRNGQAALQAYDSPWLACALYFIPGSDYPPSPGSIGTASLWHVLRIIALFFLLFAELPVPCVLGASLALTHGSGIVSAWGTWNLAFSPSAGTFYASVLFVLEGLAILSLPTAVVGSATIGRLRWVNGWILLAAGVIDFLLGLLFQESIRWRRGQIGKPGKDKSIKKQVKEAWQAISEHLKIPGLLMRQMEGMDDAVDAWLKD